MNNSTESIHLTDAYGRRHNYLRISVTDRCNFRCRYCMPPEGVPPKSRGAILSFDEIARFSRIMADSGISKIRLTGGEPLVRKNLPELAARLSAIPGIETVGLTTNGTLLKEHLTELKAAGVSRLNISVDSLQPERFRQITLGGELSRVLEAIDLALQAGFHPLKINTVIMRHINSDELPGFAEFARQYPLEVRFIEFMPFRANHWNREVLMTSREMKQELQKFYELTPLPPEPQSTARRFTIKGFAGTLSFISPISNHFCSDCNRLRLTADGRLKNCLFSGDALDIRQLLRDSLPDTEISSRIRAALQRKNAAHPGVAVLSRSENQIMTEIGG
ncbi:MAG: GTP 3',8-cyclase MoaA [Calditrichia bacterium]